MARCYDAQRRSYAACGQQSKNMSEEIKQACHELTKSWEAIGGGASGQYHGNDYQQGLRTAYNQCAYELKEMLAVGRKTAMPKTPEPSTLASATGYTALELLQTMCELRRNMDAAVDEINGESYARAALYLECAASKLRTIQRTVDAV